jgi:hypothetical protein
MVGGIYVFGRILDKIRLFAKEGKLPEAFGRAGAWTAK